MIKIEHINDEGPTHTVLIEVKRTEEGSYDMYVDGKLRGSSGSYEICRNEVGEYARSLTSQYFDKDM